MVAFADPRTTSMGVRVLCAEQSLELDGVEKIDGPDEYNLMRQTLGIPESSSELGGQLPLNMHLHYLNGISFDKGCYIGQELTQRTFHTGVIRRIAMPFVTIPEDAQLNSTNFNPVRSVDPQFEDNLRD